MPQLDIAFGNPTSYIVSPYGHESNFGLPEAIAFASRDRSHYQTKLVRHARDWHYHQGCQVQKGQIKMAYFLKNIILTKIHGNKFSELQNKDLVFAWILHNKLKKLKERTFFKF